PPVPTPEARTVAHPVATPVGQRGWPGLEIIDKRDLDPVYGPLLSEPVIDVIRRPGRVLCILNRTGRVRLLICAQCSAIARCEVCDGAVSLESSADLEEFVCSRGEHRRPPI